VAKTIIEEVITLATCEDIGLKIPEGAELINVRYISPVKAVLTFIADVERPLERVHLVDRVPNEQVLVHVYPYYVGSANSGVLQFHLFSDRPLDPYNPRHYTNAQ